MSATLNGWQAIAALLVGALCVAGGVLLGAAGAPLIALGSSIVGACLGILQPHRNPQARTRAADRIPTAAQGVPVIAAPWESDPDYRTPPPRAMGEPPRSPRLPPGELPPGVPEDRRRRPR